MRACVPSPPARRRFPRTLIVLLLLLAPVTLAAGEGGASLTHRMMLLAIQVGVILFAAKAGNVLAEKVRLPGALGELLVGAVIGAYLLGGLSLPGFPRGLFPLAGGHPVRPELAGLAMLASVVLLFHIGLETDLKLLLRYALAGGLAGMGGMVASFFLGAGIMAALSGWLWGTPLGLFAPPCLMLGTITTATSVGITARILSERR